MRFYLVILLFCAVLSDVVSPGDERVPYTLSLNDIGLGETILPTQTLQYSLNVQPIVRPEMANASVMTLPLFVEIGPCSSNFYFSGLATVGGRDFTHNNVTQYNDLTVFPLRVKVPIIDGKADPFVYHINVTSVKSQFTTAKYTIRAWSWNSTEYITGGVDRPGTCGTLVPSYDPDTYITEVSVAFAYTRRIPGISYFLCSAPTPQDLYKMKLSQPSNTSSVTCYNVPAGLSDQIESTAPLPQRHTAVTVIALRGNSTTRYQVLNFDRGAIPIAAKTIKELFICIIIVITVAAYLFILGHSIKNYHIMKPGRILRMKMRSFVIPIDLKGSRYVLMGGSVLHFIASFATAMLGPLCVIFIVTPLIGLIASILYSSLLVFIYQFFSLVCIGFALQHLILNAFQLCGSYAHVYENSYVTCESLTVVGSVLYVIAALTVLFLQLTAHLFNIKLLRYKAWLQQQDSIMQSSGTDSQLHFY
ncbi:hypothetical protein PROFUN_00558 [Planoprotostelium fungivorum]|uniref:Uncharacterized protein n=1 Tax=Planoprotostelium fungivorum TaxID=1890364 RepID=A0A2P6N151_9EUKA|nr:hypothetical protein PROFUN_00558 [Planoprotostelium fungivorum]